MKTSIMMAIALAAVSVSANTPPEITNVRASQREGTKLVDIYWLFGHKCGSSQAA